MAVGLTDVQIQKGLSTFQNAAHRLEPVAEINGIGFINDSKATNVDSVFYALNSLRYPYYLDSWRTRQRQRLYPN
jgi:UDP-N-acetylmuramoylalanine--D-glutamate ligase